MTDEINNFHESNQNNFRNELESPSKSDNFILNYKTNSNLYGISFQTKDECRIALSTIEMSKNNRIEILEIVDDQLKRVCVEDQEFPSTKLMWNPNLNSSSIIASSSDVMRLYKYNSDNKKLDLNLKLNNKKSKYCAPLTSFDWNRENFKHGSATASSHLTPLRSTISTASLARQLNKPRERMVKSRTGDWIPALYLVENTATVHF